MNEYFLIIILSVLGFSVASYIRYKKSRNERLVCYMGDDCNKVVFSSYSTLLGIPNEMIGMAYFSLMAAFLAILLILPDLDTLLSKTC